MIVAVAAIMGIFIGFWVGLRCGVKICDELARAQGIDITADTVNVREVKAKVSGYESEL